MKISEVAEEADSNIHVIRDLNIIVGQRKIEEQENNGSSGQNSEIQQRETHARPEGREHEQRRA